MFVGSLPFAACSRPRSRRQLEFTIITNISIPCAELQVEGQQVIHQSLTDADKMELFIREGGDFIRSFMAVTQMDAQKDFPSLIGLEASTEV